MAGSIDEAEDLVQETMMRAWRGRARLRGAVVAPNLAHRIATNVPFTELEHRPRRVLVPDVPAEDASEPLARERRPDLGAPPDDLPWLQPVPDSLLEAAAPAEAEAESPRHERARRRGRSDRSHHLVRPSVDGAFDLPRTSEVP
jgi:RNA polymerase sigma-70 factor, ECF subfamily